MSASTPPITDPRHVPIEKPNALQRFGLSLINDPRDLPFLGLMAAFGLIVIPSALALFVPGVFRWWLGAAWLVVMFTQFFDRCILMLHNTSHRVLFKPQYRWMNQIIPWAICPFFGQAPETYFGHHMGMHHPENNLEDDLSTTMPYDRDKFFHFLRYWFSFMTSGLARLVRYLFENKRKKLAYKTLAGEIIYALVCAVGLWLAPGPTFVVFVVPLLLARFLMMWGNWGQHAFIDADSPENPLTNSITCINTKYNRRCFNDGYHIGHHVKANRHWTEMPADLEKNAARYAKDGAIVFDGIDFFQVSLFLFLKRYDWLAKHYVQLGEKTRSSEEIITYLKTRTRPVVRTLPVEVRAAA